jgi:glutamyl-Q tRNA(Asp) synthetase
MNTLTRFAPSPTGLLHLGHAYSALFALTAAREAGGQFIIRMEDIDPSRCKVEFEDHITRDLKWLGVQSDHPVRRQSDHLGDYKKVLDQLIDMNLLYPCFCTRSDIKREIEASGYAPHNIPTGPDGHIYPGTCKSLSAAEQEDRKAKGQAFALRLDMARATAHAGALTWQDKDLGLITATPEIFGDVVLARKDTPTSYHLAVSLDDHLQDITLVTRGEDLRQASHVHTLLQALLGLNKPRYHHHKLVNDDSGRRFAKRDNAATLQQMRQDGVQPEEINHLLGFPE